MFKTLSLWYLVRKALENQHFIVVLKERSSTSLSVSQRCPVSTVVVRDQINFHPRDNTDQSQVENILGQKCVEYS
jgi:hypothetical protein